MSVKICDHKSVGLLVRNEQGELLLLERKRFPVGFAPPAGHLDEDSSFEVAALRELKEEVGTTGSNLQLAIEGRKENPCRREGGTWHYWKIYTVDTIGDLEPSPQETKQVGWYSPDRIQELAERTKAYLRGDLSENEWEQNPGIEPVWYEWLQELSLV